MPLMPPPTINTSPEFPPVEILSTDSRPLDNLANDFRDILDLDARDLVCENGRADASSGSDISIHTTVSVEADASSGADVDVYGGPTDVDSDKSSGGSVSIRG